jgi:HSP20 family protein
MTEDDRKRKKEDEEPDEEEVYEDIFNVPRRRRHYDPFFGSFDAEFERMRQYMDQMMEAAMRGDLTRDDQMKPFIYGFTMRTGPDGKPHFQEFGNTRNVRRLSESRKAPSCGDGACADGTCGAPRGQGYAINGSREPLTDVIDCGDSIAVTVELPGVEKKDIHLEVAEDFLTIRVDTEGRRYFKEVELPAPVEEGTTKASYKNGVLDVTLKKSQDKRKGKKVEIE